MPPKIRHSVTVHNPGRAHADHFERVGPDMMATWRAAREEWPPWTVRWHDGEATIWADWAELAEQQIRALEEDDAFQRTRKYAPPKRRDPAKLRLTVECLGVSKRTEYLVQHYLCDAFLAFNLAAPGGFSCYRWSIDGHLGDDVRLSGLHFEGAWLSSLDGVVPEIRAVPLSKTIEWVSRAGLGVSQVADTPAKRALLCCLYVAGDQHLSPAALVWLAHALEAVFHAQALPHSMLRRRMATFLGISKPTQKSFSTHLRTFYDARNAFAHGGMSLLHPLHNDLFDRRYDEKFGELASQVDFGVQCVIAALQALVTNNAGSVAAEEILTPIPLGASGPATSNNNRTKPV